MLATLTNIKLFKGISQKDIETLLMCLDVKKRDYKKGDYVFQEGSIIEQIGIVLSGVLIIDMLDAWGNNNVLADIGPGETFLEVYACCFKEPLMINVIAKEDTTILLLNINKMISNCPKCCAFHDTLLKNLLMLTAEMNLQLSRLKRRRSVVWTTPITAPGAWMRRPAISWWSALAETQKCIPMTL